MSNVLSAETDTYPQPEHGWTCFHCGETFKHQTLARIHFGHYPTATPACQLSPAHVREELRRYRMQESKLQDIRNRLASLLELTDYGGGMGREVANALYNINSELLDAACGV